MKKPSVCCGQLSAAGGAFTASAAQYIPSIGRECQDAKPCRIGREALLEVLGLVDPRSPDLRRNTSTLRCESFRSGDKVDPWLRFVSTLAPLVGEFIEEVDPKRRQSGSMSPLPHYLSAIESR